MKNLMGNPRFLVIYSGSLTVIFAITVLTGFAGGYKQKSFDEITVRRINIVEPDGTIRMVLSNKAQFPGVIIKGEDHPHPNRTTAGMLFFNDEGTENGGLIFGGMKDKSGKVSSYGHLSFDQYEQDQMFVAEAEQEGDQSASGIKFVDQPSYPISELLALTDRTKNLPPEQEKVELDKFLKDHGNSHQRLYLGRNNDKSVALKMKDIDGHDRLVIRVNADGSPVLQFLDASGNVTTQLPQSGK